MLLFFPSGYHFCISFFILLARQPEAEGGLLEQDVIACPGGVDNTDICSIKVARMRVDQNGELVYP